MSRRRNSVQLAEEPVANSAQASLWSAQQAYTLAIVCLALGISLGYLLRGSAATTPAAQAAAPVAAEFAPTTIPGMGGLPTASASSDLVDKVVAPMLEEVKRNPKNADALAKIGNTYYDAKIYDKATQYYEQALKITPKNADIRTDMGTAYWYLGNAERAIAEFNKALADSPNHAHTMFNLGIVQWQGKKDSKTAIATWEKLLATNPGYPERQNVEQMIAQAKQ